MIENKILSVDANITIPAIAPPKPIRASIKYLIACNDSVLAGNEKVACAALYTAALSAAFAAVARFGSRVSDQYCNDVLYIFWTAFESRSLPLIMCCSTPCASV